MTNNASHEPAQFTISVDEATATISTTGIEIKGNAISVGKNELLDQAIKMVPHVAYLNALCQKPIDADDNFGLTLEELISDEAPDQVDEALDGVDCGLTVSEISDMLAAWIADAEPAELNSLGEQLRRFLSAIYGNLDFPTFVGIDHAKGPDRTSVQIVAGDPPGTCSSGSTTASDLESLRSAKLLFAEAIEKENSDLERHRNGGWMTPLSPSVRKAIEYAAHHGCGILHAKADGSLEAVSPVDFYLCSYGERRHEDGTIKTKYVPRPRNEYSAARVGHSYNGPSIKGDDPIPSFPSLDEK